MMSFTLCLMGAAMLVSAPDRPYVFHHENVLGTSMDMKVQTSSPEAATAAETAALAEIERLSGILSAWNASSEFSRWQRTSSRPVKVSPELFEVLKLWNDWRAATGDALNPSAEAATRLWKAAANRGQAPTRDELAEVSAAMERQHYRLDDAEKTATHLTATPLVLSSFTKSYILSKAADAALAKSAAEGVVLNIGGDIVVRGAISERVSVASPLADQENGSSVAMLSLVDRAIATSGNYRRGVEIGGQHYSHIVDPRTGAAMDHVLSSTVVSSDAVTAGALATAFSVLTPEESAKLAAKYPGTEYMLVLKDGSQRQSGNWPLLAANLHPMLALAPEAATPKGGFELNIALALARIDTPGYRRPYVAVWIEDKDRFPLRTIALWYEKPRWLPDLKAWYRDDRIRSMAEGNDITASVSSATRPAGKYTLKWDGNDNQGKPVKPGKYTVNIEAAREHGTYQIIRQEIEWGGAVPKQFTLAGNTEIESATLDYRKSAGK